MHQNKLCGCLTSEVYKTEVIKLLYCVLPIYTSVSGLHIGVSIVYTRVVLFAHYSCLVCTLLLSCLYICVLLSTNLCSLVYKFVLSCLPISLVFCTYVVLFT